MPHRSSSAYSQGERLGREPLGRDRLEREHLERERLERQHLQREHLQREHLERDRLERERPARHAAVAARPVAFGLRQAAGYTLSHAGRQLRIGPIAFWIVVGSLVIMAAWTLTTATYFAFHDDVLTRLIAREAEMQFGYEDRIA